MPHASRRVAAARLRAGAGRSRRRVAGPGRDADGRPGLRPGARHASARIREHNPKHGQALKLLAALYWRRQDWRALVDLLPTLRAVPPLPPEKLNRWTADAFEALLADPALDETAHGRALGRGAEDPAPRAAPGAGPRPGARPLRRRSRWPRPRCAARCAISGMPGLIRLYGELQLPEMRAAPEERRGLSQGPAGGPRPAAHGRTAVVPQPALGQGPQLPRDEPVHPAGRGDLRGARTAAWRIGDRRRRQGLPARAAAHEGAWPSARSSPPRPQPAARR